MSLNPQLQAIADHLQGNGELAGLSNAAIAEALNTPNSAYTVRTPVQIAAARGVLLASGEWAQIILTADNGAAPAEVRKACIIVRDTLSPPMQMVHTENEQTLAVITACLEGLVATQVLSGSTKDALLALSLQPVSWAQKTLGGPVNARDVALAKGDA